MHRGTKNRCHISGIDLWCHFMAHVSWTWEPNSQDIWPPIERQKYELGTAWRELYTALLWLYIGWWRTVLCGTSWSGEIYHMTRRRGRRRTLSFQSWTSTLRSTTVSGNIHLSNVHQFLIFITRTFLLVFQRVSPQWISDIVNFGCFVGFY